jgi:hypothetical protein
MSSEHKNRLALEKSPYLLQHADNPVDWYPWGAEAFQKAEKEDKPILLSIGYSTCHWCHVMEHESFEDEEIAGVMNQYFVPIKVDREERPDIDNVYMKAVMAISGHGGWPLTVFLTPEKKPFYGGTYFPPQARWGSPGFKDVLLSVHQTWQNQRKEVLESSQSLTDILQERTRSLSGESVSLQEGVLKNAYETFSRQFDAEFGGFGNAPKFPMGHSLSFLLRAWKRFDEERALIMVEKTLCAMAQGGLYDHLGGGFHRYATDRIWHVPHFEKMLYDQALLVRAYLEGHQAAGGQEYARISREVLDYVLRELHSPEGGFFSAEDADSFEPGEGKTSAPKKEGAFYVWSRQQITEQLPKEDADIFGYYFDVRPEGNAETDPHGEFKDKNILRVVHAVQETAERFQKSSEEITESLERSRKQLLDVRSKRPRPHLDDKVLTDWNGLMISSLAFGANVLKEPRYREAAGKAADFILKTMVRKDGRLLHRYREGEAAVLGTIEDYAFFINGLLDLYESGFQSGHLEEAIRLAKDMIRLFWDERSGGFFFTGSDAESLIFKEKESYDGALPSGNSMAALALVRLFHLTLDQEWISKAETLWKLFANEISRNPGAHAQMLTAFDFDQGPAKEIVIAAEERTPEVRAMLDEIYRNFLPNKVVVLHLSQADESEKIVRLAPLVKEQLPVKGQPTAYVCENHVCRLPTTDAATLKELLAK